MANSQNEIRGEFELLMEKDGLKNHEITCIQKDTKGYLWIGTPDGLVRYDGYSFYTYRSSTLKNSVADNNITALVREDSKGLWMGHGNGMVTRYDFLKDSFVQYQVYDQSKGEPVSLLYFDTKNNLWAAIERVGLFKFNSENKRFDLKGSLPNADLSQIMLDRNSNNSISAMQEDSIGNFWLAAKNGLFYYDTKESKITSIDSQAVGRSVQLTDILIDSLGNLWIASWGSGLVYYNVETKKFKTFLWEDSKIGVSNISRSLNWKGENEIWVATYDGLAYFNLVTSEFSFYSNESANYPGVWIEDLLVDSTNTLWLISEKGLAKLKNESRMFVFQEQQVTSTSTNEDFYLCSFIFHDTIDNTIYAGTSFADGFHITKAGKSNIVKFNTNKFSEEHLVMRDYLYDKKGNIWILTRDYLYMVDKSRNQLVKASQPSTDDGKSPAFSRIIESSNGLIWIASLRKGLFCFNPANNVYIQYATTETGNSICSNSINDIIEDNKKRIWIASSQDGLSMFDPMLNYFTNFNSKNSSLTSSKLNALAKTLDGSIWIASTNGLYQCKTDSGFIFKNWTVNDGLPSSRISYLKTDLKNNLWGITSSNILFAAQLKTQNKLSVKAFDYSDGLNRPLFGLGNDGTGNFYVSSTGGYYSFNPQEALKPLSNSPLLVLTSLLVNNDRVFPIKDSNQSDFLTLDHNQNVISFEFAALSFTHPSKNLYSYILEGVDNTWSPSSIERSVKYSALQPGDYTFRVRLVDSIFAQNPEYSLRIFIAEPFWKTWWFILSNVLFVACILITLHRLRLNQVRQKQAQKAEFQQKIAEAEMHALRLQMNPHFIFNSLNSINRFILKSDVEQATHYLTKFSKLIRLILDNSKSKIISLDQELTTIKLYIELESVRFNGKFNYSVHLADDINAELVIMPPMLIQPFIENAIWHGLLHKNSVGNIQVLFQKENDFLVCTVQDDGIGRKMAQQFKSKSAVIEKSYGMKITKDRLTYENHYGNQSSIDVIDLVSSDGSPLGTKVVVKIKIVEVELN